MEQNQIESGSLEAYLGGLELIKVTREEMGASCDPTYCGPKGSCDPNYCGPKGNCDPTYCGPKSYSVQSMYKASCEPCCPACRPNGG